MAFNPATNLKQVYCGTPGGEYILLDAAAAAQGQAYGCSGAAGAPGYDETNVNGALNAQSQGLNIKPNGNVVIDSFDDYLPSAQANKTACVSGNPVSNTAITASLCTVVLNTQNVRLVFKNPA
jgi:hypothetical protein